MKVYNASKTISDLFACDNRIQLLLGPIGGGKTTGILMKIITLAHQQRANGNGHRKTRWGVVRNTKSQLKDSVLKSVFDWLPPDGHRIIWRESDMTLELRIPLADGTEVRSELLFRALDDERDARRLLSVEYTGVWLSEFREIPIQLLTDALSRTGRYPSATDGGPSWRGVLGESNMPVRGSEWFNYMELERPENCTVFKQPSALSPFAENLQYLEPDYYTALLAGATKRWIQAHITCEYPDSLDGKAVYANSFESSRHVSPISLNPIAGAVILMGIDQGRNPAAVFAQVDPRGGLRVLREVYATDVGMEKFANEYLRPVVAQYFPGYPILAVADPAANTRNDANDVTAADMLRAAGFKVQTAPTNQLDRRIEAVERFLNRHDGFIVDGKAAPKLVEGMANSYRFKLKSNGEAEDKPEKKHPISDLQDALQYLALIAGGVNYGRIMDRMVRGVARTSGVAPPPVRGWT